MILTYDVVNINLKLLTLIDNRLVWVLVWSGRLLKLLLKKLLINFSNVLGDDLSIRMGILRLGRRLRHKLLLLLLLVAKIM